MKTFFWLWVMILIVCLVTDTAVYWVTRSRLSQGLELALDAALVSGISEEDLIWGRKFLREAVGEARGVEVLKGNITGPAADKMTYSFEFVQEQDLIWVQGQVRTELPSLLGSVLGKGSKEISVSKKMSYLGGYK